MRRFGRPARLALSLATMAASAGCGGAKPAQGPAPRPVVPLAIRRPDSSMKVFSGQEETPGATYAFSGAAGSVRVTMEVDGPSGPAGANPPPLSRNDVLFKAEGEGRISVAFKRPGPDHPNGRVTIRCESGDEASSAEFEPELWYHLPAAIVTFESAAGEAKDPVVPGKEVVLGRYVARNVPRDVRLSFKAVFTREPVAPRTKVGPRPVR